MQTLEPRNTYTPTNAPQVRCNCDPSLNREETRSRPGLKTSSNNSDVDLLVLRVPDNGTCEFPFQKLSSIEHENDCRFVNPAYTHWLTEIIVFDMIIKVILDNVRK